jgi:hypothetical protein
MKFKPTFLIVQISLFLFLCFLFHPSFSQHKETAINKVYLFGAAGITSYDGVSGELGIQATFKKHWVGSVSYQTLDMNPKNVPGNYDPGYTLFLILPIGNGYPNTTMTIVNFSAGKIFEASRRIWFTTEAGLSVVSGEKLQFTSTPVINDLFSVSPNYSIRKEKVSTAGVLLKADFNWAFCPFLGLGAGVFANLNSIQSPVGFQVKLIGGWMHLKPKTKRE